MASLGHNELMFVKQLHGAYSKETKAPPNCPFLRGVPQWSPNRGTVMQKEFAYHDIIMRRTDPRAHFIPLPDDREKLNLPVGQMVLIRLFLYILHKQIENKKCIILEVWQVKVWLCQTLRFVLTTGLPDQGCPLLASWSLATCLLCSTVALMQFCHDWMHD